MQRPGSEIIRETYKKQRIKESTNLYLSGDTWRTDNKIKPQSILTQPQDPFQCQRNILPSWPPERWCLLWRLEWGKCHPEHCRQTSSSVLHPTHPPWLPMQHLPLLPLSKTLQHQPENEPTMSIYNYSCNNLFQSLGLLFCFLKVAVESSQRWMNFSTLTWQVVTTPEFKGTSSKHTNWPGSLEDRQMFQNSVLWVHLY